ncbi:MAG: peptide ABC transporter substrate-binding protein [Phycisphaerae bacterium]|nr:peptide ABC transporter substrate-binding protein [Phycisphaerae bacterium]NUQ47178.1 peptide ABC transporter substrate-binding protein [Phycisphaerae bacterium]
MRIIILVLFAILLAAVAAVAWSADEAPAQFRFSGSGAIATLDPAQMSWIQDLRIAGLMYEGLFATDPDTLRPIPACAEQIDIDASGREYTFRLRADARWSNGDPVAADDFIFAWRRAIEPGTAADYAFFFHDVEGLADYVAWRWQEINRIAALPPSQRFDAATRHLAEADARFAQTVALRAVNPQTLHLRLRRPVAYWLDIVSFAAAYPLHRRSVEPHRRVGESGIVYYDEQWAKPGCTHYNGPYALSDWRFKRGLTLRRNSHYWDRGRIHIESVACLDVADPDTAWLMYSTGRLDWLPSVEASFAPVLVAQARQRADIHPYRAFGTYYYNINCRPRLWDGRPNPFADPRVRRAFSLAVDRAALVDHVTRRGEPPATTLVPPGVIPDYPSVEGMGFDPGRAQTELAAAGYPGGRGFPRVRLLYSTDGPHGLIAESIAGMWRRTLGVSVRLAGKEVQSFREDKKNQVFMIARASWYGDYLDPTTFLDTLRRENGNNDSAFADDAYEALLDAAEAEHHPGARLSRLAEAERYLVNEAAPIIPLYGFVHIAAFDPARAEGLNVNARMVLSLKDVTLRDNEGTSATAD